jgi:hypothetical protein
MVPAPLSLVVVSRVVVVCCWSCAYNATLPATINPAATAMLANKTLFLLFITYFSLVE